MSVIGLEITGITGLYAPPWLAVTIRAQASTLRLISKAGTTAEFTRTTGQQYNPSTGDLTAGSVATWSAHVVIEEYAAKEIDGTLIQRGDCKLLLPGVAPKPLVGDTITLGGTVWHLVNVATEQPAGIPILYTIQVRR